jgi:hypothetical protein
MRGHFLRERRGGLGRGLALDAGNKQFTQIRRCRQRGYGQSQVADYILMTGQLSRTHRAVFAQMYFECAGFMLAQSTKRVKRGYLLDLLSSLFVLQDADLLAVYCVSSSLLPKRLQQVA